MKLYNKYEKTELENYIFNEKLSYREIGRKYDVSDAYIKKICKKLDIKLPQRSKFPKGWAPHNKGKIKSVICKNCNISFLSGYRDNRFCSIKCNSEYKKLEHINDYLNNQNKYCNETTGMRFIKPYILSQQNNRCAICNIENIWNNKNIVFVLDHIDGNASNNLRENLRLVCPNCDSQLDTYKSKNKNSARKQRYLLNYKNI